MVPPREGALGMCSAGLKSPFFLFRGRTQTAAATGCFKLRCFSPSRTASTKLEAFWMKNLAFEALLFLLAFVAGCGVTTLTPSRTTGGDDEVSSDRCPPGLACLPTSLGEAFCLTPDRKFPIDASYCEHDDDCPASLVCPIDGHGPAWNVCLKICDPEAADGDLDDENGEPSEGDGEQVEDGDVNDDDVFDGDEPPAPCLNNADCDDGNTCDGVETCGVNGLCRPGTPLRCEDDGNPCTGVVSCDPAVGCVTSDPPVCVGNTACVDGEAAPCDDEIDCTVDTCHPERGCVHEPVHEWCGDGIDCTNDACSLERGCVNHPVNGLCADWDPGTVDVCVAGVGCLRGSASKWLSIPSGTNEMGCVPQQGNCPDDERPRHAVTISAFQMAETETTQAQFQAVMGFNPSTFDLCGPDCPVETVTWFDAKAYCEAIGGRLPTEAEWEYAARAWTDTIYICGDDPACLENAAWWGPNSNYEIYPAGLKRPNGWGLHDMEGNVTEWTADWFGPYSAEQVVDPTGPSEGTLRTARGGWFGIQETSDIHLSRRYRGNPTDAGGSIGFRCARNLVGGE